MNVLFAHHGRLAEAIRDISKIGMAAERANLVIDLLARLDRLPLQIDRGVTQVGPVPTGVLDNIRKNRVVGGAARRGVSSRNRRLAQAHITSPRGTEVRCHRRSGPGRGGHVDPEVVSRQRGVKLIKQIILLDIRQDVIEKPQPVRTPIIVGHSRRWRKSAEGAVKVVDAQPQLLHVVRTLHAARRFPRGLDRRQQHGDQDANDSDHHEQFNERESLGCRTLTERSLSSTPSDAGNPCGNETIHTTKHASSSLMLVLGLGRQNPEPASSSTQVSRLKTSSIDYTG